MNSRSISEAQTCSAQDAKDAGALSPGTCGATPALLPRQDQLILAELVLPEQANHYGTLFGPNGLALLGKSAYLVATRFTRQSIVMVAANGIEFLRPVPVGTVLQIEARVTRVGRSSLTTQVVARFDAAPGTRADVAFRGDFELVAVDDVGRPIPITAPALSEQTRPEPSVAAVRG